MPNKRVLILSSWAPPMVGGPQNLYNLFSCRPAEEYAIVTSRANLLQGLKINISGSWLPCHYYYAEGGTIDRNQQDYKQVAPTAPGVFDRIIGLVAKIPYLGPRMLSLGNLCWTVVRFVRAARRAIRAEKSEMLLGISDTGVALLSTWLTSRLTGVPYDVYLFDLYKGNLLSQPYKWVANRFERFIMTQAHRVILTNEVTEEYYHRRYGKKIRTAVVHNSIFDRQTVVDYHPQPPYTIVFTGNVYWAQEHSVMNLIKAMDQLKDLPLRLKLYVPNPPPTLLAAINGSPNIELSAAPQSAMPEIQHAATLLFLPLAWHTKAPDIIATATPGKFTDYLDSGRPMLVHAPDYACVSLYTRQHNLGIVVDQDDVTLLATTIRDFLANPTRGTQLITNALAVFLRNHEATKNSEKLTQILNMV